MRIRSGLSAFVLPSLLSLAAAGPAAAQFTDRSAEVGLEWYESTWGAAFEDVDLDGDLDLYTGHHFGDPILYWNDGTGVFSSDLYPQPWTQPIDRHGPLFVPIDTDRDADLFIAHGGSGGSGEEDNELFRNDDGSDWRSFLGAGGMADGPGRGRAASAADWNGDGRADVFIAKAPDAASPNSLFRNDQNFWLHDIAAEVGLDETLGTVGGIWGDFDDDGDPDLLVGGEEFLRPTKLWRNDGAVFSDATAAISPAPPIVSGADWGDFDNDGDLDLALCSGAVGLFDVAVEGDSVKFYFNTRYDENGVDGLTIPSVSPTATATVRVTGQLDPESIFLGPLGLHPPTAENFGLSNTYRGQPDFTPGVDRGVYIWRQSFNGPWEIRCSTPALGESFDGAIVQGGPVFGIVRHDFEDPDFDAGAPLVYENDEGTLTDISSVLGLPPNLVNPRQVAWVDYDNDGDLDLHVVDKGTSGFPNAPDKLYRNDGFVFTDVTELERMGGGNTGLGDGAVWGDTDNDGDLDCFLMEGEGPAFYSENAPSRLYVNDGNRGPSLQIDLIGRDSGPSVIGTKVRAVVGGLSIQRRVEANSWRGFQDPRRVHIGLNGAAQVDALIIEWPSGIVDVHGAIPAGIWEIEEGEVNTASPWSETGRGEGWVLGGVFPQPARGEQTLRLSLTRPATLDVSVHDVGGRLVRALHRGPLEAGARELSWDGRDDAGVRVASGVYFVRASDGRATTVRRAVRVR